MIVCKLTSGFGNQMFQFAQAYSLSQRTGEKLVIDALSYDEKTNRPMEMLRLSIGGGIKGILYYPRMFKIFRMIIRCVYMFGRKKIVETDYFKFDKEVYDEKSRRLYIKGFWQSDKYFRDYQENIKKLYQLQNPTTGFEQKYNEIYNGHYTAIHIRRGDYVDINSCLSMQYYYDCIAKVNTENDNMKFLVFSDDISWGKQHLNQIKNLEFFEEPEFDDVETLFLMSAADNIIIANSSYSWWAAYLNSHENKKVYAPSVGKWSGDFYPDEWIKVQTVI